LRGSGGSLATAAAFLAGFAIGTADAFYTFFLASDNVGDCTYQNTENRRNDNEINHNVSPLDQIAVFFLLRRIKAP
jgi:hypothetical protein